MKQTFQASLEARFFWSAGIIFMLVLYWGWILSTNRPAEISLLAWLGGLGLTWLGWRGLAFLFQRVTLTDEGVVIRQGWQPQMIAYDDIFYARPKSGRLTGLTLVTTAGESKIGRHVGAPAELVARLEQQIPNLTTPRTRLPWRVPGNRSQRFILLGVALLFGGFSLLFGVAALADGSLMLFIAALLMGGVAGLCGLGFAKTPVSYSFSEETIERRTLLQTEQFGVAELIALFRANDTVRTKQGPRRVQRIVLRFKPERTLKISPDEIGYPFEEFYTILTYHYAPDKSARWPWPRQAADIDHHKFAKGSLHDFRTYFEQESGVTVTSIDEICRWLQGCAYIHDRTQFQEEDHWLHPVEFERRRKGDCEDHALWAWRKLIELGYAAEFVVGGLNDGYHAWIVYEEDGQHSLFESVNKNRPIINPVEKVKTAYRPDYSIDHNFVTYRYQGGKNEPNSAIRAVENQAATGPDHRTE